MNEAPFSWNSRYTLNGWDCQLTIRADTWPDLKKQVDEAVQDLAAKAAVPAVMIYRDKQNGSGAPSKPATTSAPVTPRGPGRPPKRPDTYIDEEGAERCNHLVNGERCTTIGEWKEFPDKYRPGQTKLLWSCAEFFNHDDYKAKKALEASTGGSA